jgi:hypothetical protein
MSSEAVSGLVRNERHAEEVSADLQAAGVHLSDISVLFASREAPPGDHARTAAAQLPPFDGRAGATVGAVLGLFAGLGGIAIAGLGPVLAAGPMLATFGSAALGAAAGALVGRAVPERNGAHGPCEVPASNLVLSVYTESPSQVSVVKRILEAHAADHVSVGRAHGE